MFDDRTLAALDGHLAIGHCRYSTTGSSTWRNAQPAYRGAGARHFALGHNGNLTNTEALAEEDGMLPGTVTSDTDLIAELISNELLRLPEESQRRARPRAGHWPASCPGWKGAFSLVLMDEGRVIGVRDPNGFRPLCLGKLDHGWVLASESPALDIVGAHFVRELDPGEMVVIDATGPRSLRPFPDERVDPRLCLFEFVYFARPDTPPLRPERPPGARPHRRAARRAGPGRGRHGDGRARVGRARRRGLRPAQRHPVRPGRGEEPLHRPQLHRAEPGAPGLGPCA